MNKNSRFVRAIAAASLAVSLAACAVGPAYHRPETAVVEPRNVDAHFAAAAPGAAW